MNTQTAADLRAAAEVLRRDGWTRRLYSVPRWYAPWRRRYCASGALLRIIQPTAAGAFDLSMTERWRWYRAAWAVERRVGRSLEVWNDTPGRTADEVIAALEAAAAAEATP